MDITLSSDLLESIFYFIKLIKTINLQNRIVTDTENTHMVMKGEEGRDKLGDWDWHIYTTVYKIDN